MTVIIGKNAIHLGWQPACVIALFLISSTWGVSTYLAEFKQDLKEIKSYHYAFTKKDSLQDIQIEETKKKVETNARDIRTNREDIKTLKAGIARSSGGFVAVRKQIGE